MKLTVRFFSLLSVSVLFASCCQTRTSDVPVYLDDNQPLFAFGHGLSYTEFTYGEAKTVTFNVDPEKLMYFDDAKHEWVLEKGVFAAYVGSASDDIRTQISFEIK